MIRKTQKETEPLSQKPKSKNRGRLLAVALAGAAVLAGVAYGVYAKYYANTSNKGVTTAANCYFSSNLLKDMTETEEYAGVFNTDIWNGNSVYKMDLQVRNFQSQILYNDSNLDLTYDITFELIEPSDGGTYKVSYENEPSHTLQYGEPYTIKGITLLGGSAEKTLFTVSFDPPNEHESNYISDGVKVTAKTTAPDYAVGRVLGGILYASVFTAEYKLENEFDFSQNELNSMAGLPYTVTYTPDVDNQVHTFEIKWDSNQLELDKFTAQKYGMETNGTLEVEIEPFASLHLIFYRKEGFRADTIIDDDTLNNLVTVKDKTLENEGD